jgi:hypothetical protein
MIWQGILIGLVTGIIATLIADNPHVRFNLERLFRQLIGRPLISATLSGFTNFCNDGIFLIYCIELKNKMWLTSQIPKIYLLSMGDIEYDSRAYKPFIYFRSHGMSIHRLNQSMEQLLEEYGSKIISYTPDNPNLGLALSRIIPYRVVVLCELIKLDILKKDKTKEHALKAAVPLNSMKVVGDLRLPVADPMPKTYPGASWNTSVISEDFGLIDSFNISIPQDLEEQQPLGDTWKVFMMKNRAPCLLDLGPEMLLTWPLRFHVDGCEITVKSNNPKEIEIKKPKKKIHGLEIRGKSKKRRIDIIRGIQIQ